MSIQPYRLPALPSLTLIAAATAAFATPALAQAGTGGFKAGDLYLHSSAWSGASSADGAIVHIDPTNGAATVFHDLATSGPNTQGLAYDPWRDRLLFFGGFVANSIELWASDASGNLQSFGLQTISGGSRGLLAPRGDGIVYFLSPSDLDVISYLDATDQVQVLQDATGTSPWAFGITDNNIQSLIYVPEQNCLLATRWSFFDPCAGIPNDVTALHRLDLSADGTRVVSETCFWFDAASGDWDGETRGLSIAPNGDPILVIGQGNTGFQPQARVARVDLDTNTVTAFAQTDFNGQQRIVAGTYSRALGKTLVLDSFNDVLRAFGEGEVGEGTTIATGVSSPGGSGERATLVEIATPAQGGGLGGSPSSLSLAAGGVHTLSLDLGPTNAGLLYLVLGSRAGWAPGLAVGSVTVPLVPDGWFDFTLAFFNQAQLGNTLGVLDAHGLATATLTLPPGLTPTLAGEVFHHAAVLLDSALVVVDATNPVPLTLTP
ncbi:MAG: hypothetical protein ACYS26_08915 [Planctomycetota bacterium]